jgi:glycosyltransferase involved in cell wall biosynthesis
MTSAVPGVPRVAVDATSLYDVRTGVGRFVQELLHQLGGRPDVDVLAYAVTWRGQGELASLVPPGIEAARQRMAATPLRKLWRRADHPRIERWTGSIDLVHGPNFVVPPSQAARVVSIHDLTFLHHPEYCTKHVLEYPGLLRRALATGAWVHTDSAFVRDEVVALLGADPDRVVAVPLGVTPGTSHDAARGRQLAGGDRYVLALGTVEPRKNLPGLVAAFDAVAADDDEIRLVLAGPDGWGTAALAEALARSPHTDRIVRAGFVAEADRGDLFAGAAVVAVPSFYEGFGLTAAEALRAAVPVVASDTGSHREVIGDAGLLVPATDTDALAGALRRVLTDDALAADLRRRGPAQVAPLTWDRTADGIVALWQRAIAAHRTAP